MNAGITTEAVVFLGGDGAAKEMLFPEFEAILDNVVALVDFKGQKIRGVYLQINPYLQITAAVCFYTNFDEGGFVDRGWNLPLSHLAETGTRGPDLGAGSIKLSCRSHCSVSWHQRHLWDPDLQDDSPVFRQLIALVERNRLGLLQETPPQDDIPTLGETVPAVVPPSAKIQELKQKYKAKINALNDEHALKLSALKAEASDHIERLQRHYSSELKKQQQQLSELNTELLNQRQRNQHYKQALSDQRQDLSDARETLQTQLSKSQHVAEAQLNELHEKYQQETKAQVDSVKAESKEMLEMREVELFYREEQITGLREEVTQLRQEKQELLNNSGGRVLQQLADQGVSFVSYHSGSEPIAIPVADLANYLESPAVYIARQLGVEPELYHQWLVHTELPVCTAEKKDGSLCGEQVLKIDKPSRFIPGESDRCVQHNATSEVLSDLIRMREPH